MEMANPYMPRFAGELNLQTRVKLIGMDLLLRQFGADVNHGVIARACLAFVLASNHVANPLDGMEMRPKWHISPEAGSLTCMCRQYSTAPAGAAP